MNRFDVKKHKINPTEKGIALITVMLMMAVMSFLAVTMYNTSNVESMISSNYRSSKQAFYDADAGVQYVLAKLNSDIESTDLSDIVLSDYSAPAGFNFDLAFVNNPPVIGNNCFTSTTLLETNASSSIEACLIIEEVINPAFGVGIVSEGDITINGAPDMTGSIHANGSIVQNGEGTVSGSVSAVGSVSVDSTVNGDTISDADYMEIPKVTQEFLDEMRSEVQLGSEDKYEYYSGNNVKIGDDIQDKIIFVDGDLTIDQNTKISNNTTIIATGNITFKGESSFVEGSGPDDEGFEINTAIIAGGDITFNGSGDSYGIFWCNGDFTRNGSSYAHGSIVAAGGVDNPDIVFNGVFEFKHFEDINNDFIPKQTTAVLSKWSDKSLL